MGDNLTTKNLTTKNLTIENLTAVNNNTTIEQTNDNAEPSKGAEPSMGSEDTQDARDIAIKQLRDQVSVLIEQNESLQFQIGKIIRDGGKIGQKINIQEPQQSMAQEPIEKPDFSALAKGMLNMR